MRSVGIFTYSTRPRGSVVHACHLAEALGQRGHEVTLYALSKAGDELYRPLSCEVVLLPAGPAPQDPDALIRQRVDEVARGVLALRPRHDVYHAEDCLVASGLLRARGGLPPTPVVRTLHHVERYESAYLRDCQARSVLEVERVACVSRSSQRDVLDVFGRSCPIIGNGVDVARFATRLPELERELLRRLGMSDGEPLVLSVGGVEPRKNSITMLQALRQVLERVPRARWAIVGGSSIWEHEAYRRQFRGELEQLSPSVRARVIELGQVPEDELTALYGLSRVLCCASLQEGFGLCVLEALAAGSAVVASRTEPFTEYLSDSCAGLVEPTSPEQIASAVLALLRDDTLRASRVREGRLCAALHGWTRVAEQHERLYAEVIVSQRLRAAERQEVESCPR